MFTSVTIKNIGSIMKKILFSLLIVFTCTLMAQETLFSGTVTHGGFGAPEIKFTQIGDNFGVLVGGKGGWIINHIFVIGGGGYGLVNNIPTNNIINNERMNLNFGYGGLILEYIQDWDKLLHYSFSALIGGGALSFRDRRNHQLEDSDITSFFIVEPGANAEVNIASFFRLNAGISYRLIPSVNFDRFNEQNMSGLAINLTFKFGKF
jgi:hypothetical protein